MELDRLPENPESYTQKFVRVGRKIYIDEESDAGKMKPHRSLAIEEGVHPHILSLVAKGSPEADAGFLLTGNIRNELIAYGKSESLKLPANPKARGITEEVLKEHFPDKDVSGRDNL